MSARRRARSKNALAEWLQAAIVSIALVFMCLQEVNANARGYGMRDQRGKLDERLNAQRFDRPNPA